jgi:hypothetical protein
VGSLIDFPNDRLSKTLQKVSENIAADAKNGDTAQIHHIVSVLQDGSESLATATNSAAVAATMRRFEDRAGNPER